ncbi:MAG: SGNH/GDSL hydrolase family protein [Candidatus Sabulitectum sp.]|nr:SGNH/GDSL hydrolase family protein [Candidatus Sabulitectum sp.]
MDSRAFLKTLLGIVCIALSFVLFALFTSHSTDGVILGRWSVSMALLLFVLLIFFLTAALLLVKSNSFHKRLSPPAAKIPDFSAGLLTTVLPVLLFLVWFLFPVPILQRKTFVTGIALFSLTPGLILMALYEPRRQKTALGGTVVMVFSIVAAIALAEFVLHAFMPRSIFNPRFGLRPYQKISLEVDLPGVTPGGTLSTNMWGLRGDDPPEQWDEYLTIVTVGGSTTANYYLDDRLTWSHIIQSRLREIQPLTWVGNGGIPRHSSDTHSLFVREVLSQIRPDVALFLVGVNDMGPFLRGSVCSVERLPDSGARQVLFSRSMVLQLMYKLKKVYIDGAPVITQSVDPYYREVPMTEEEASLPADLHDLLGDPEYYQRRIRLIIQECRVLGITPVFMTQPILFQNNDHWRGILEVTQWLEGSENPLSAASFSLMLGTLNNDLIEVCLQEDVAVFDLASEIPHSKDYFYDTMHMTELGAELVGEKASGFLVEYLESEELLCQGD